MVDEVCRFQKKEFNEFVLECNKFSKTLNKFKNNYNNFLYSLGELELSSTTTTNQNILVDKIKYINNKMISLNEEISKFKNQIINNSISQSNEELQNKQEFEINDELFQKFLIFMMFYS